MQNHIMLDCVVFFQAEDSSSNIFILRAYEAYGGHVKATFKVNLGQQLRAVHRWVISKVYLEFNNCVKHEWINVYMDIPEFCKNFILK